MNHALYEELVACLLRADRPAASGLIRSALAEGRDPGDLLLATVQPAIREIGDLWTAQRASMTQYFVAGRIADDITNLVVPLLDSRSTSVHHGRIVIGTIIGDYHGMGRKIVASFMRASGLEVIDLGMAVSADQFASAAVEHMADIVAVSALMLSSLPQINKLRPLLREQGADRVRIIVGGAPFQYREELCSEVGADATAADAGDAVRVVHELLGAVPSI